MKNDTPTTPSLELNDFLTAFDLDRANIKDIQIYHEEGGLIIELSLNVTEHQCPVCNTKTSKIKDYRLKKINHSILNPVSCTIYYHARRYICPICGKAFYENNPFAFDGFKFSAATVYNVLTELKRAEATFTYVGEKYHMSPSSVSNIFDRFIVVSRRSLPECLCFDETYAFKSENSQYICVLLDYTDKKIVDILPSRRKRDLIDYFYTVPLAEREQVKYVSFDMWQTYRAVSKLMFPNCICIVDKFHVLQELTRKLTRVRVDVMNKNKKIMDELKDKKRKLKASKERLSPEEEEKLSAAQTNYYLLKKFHFVLVSSNPKVTDPNYPKQYNHFLHRFCNLYDIHDLIMNIDADLQEAVEISDRMHRFYKKFNENNAKKELEEIIIQCRTSDIKLINDYSKTLITWKQEIINSFIKIPSIDQKMNSALIENRNKTIKLIKHSSNGYTNWERFRKKVLFCLNDDIPVRITNPQRKKGDKK